MLPPQPQFSFPTPKYFMRKHYLLAFIVVLMTGCGGTDKQNPDDINTGNSKNIIISKELPWSIRMAQSTMKRYPEAWMMEGRTKPKWSYSHGVTLIGFEALWKQTENEIYFNYIKDYADTCIREDGSIINYTIEEYNIDRVSNGKFLMELYEATGNEKYKIAFQTLREQMKTHPRTSENGYWHKLRYPWQMWLDGLYMASPFLAEYAAKYNEPEIFDDVATQILLMEEKARDDATGLLYHGWDEKKVQSWADPNTGLSKNFWGRAMGWYSMAIIDVLDYFPEDHPKRNDLIDVFKRLTDAIIKVQNEKTGLWYQVLDQANREGNYFEATVNCMFSYALLKGIRNGYIDDEYLPQAKKAYNGILNNMIKTDDDGEIHLIQCNHVSGLSDDRPGTYEYYINESVGNDDPKGVGPFILASIEMEMLGK